MRFITSSLSLCLSILASFILTEKSQCSNTLHSFHYCLPYLFLPFSPSHHYSNARSISSNLTVAISRKKIAIACINHTFRVSLSNCITCNYIKSRLISIDCDDCSKLVALFATALRRLIPDPCVAVCNSTRSVCYSLNREERRAVFEDVHSVRKRGEERVR